jgi:hypothetical protein
MSEDYGSSALKPAATPALITTALLDAVDYGLLAPGEIVRATIYGRIEESYQIRREEIPDHLDTFYKALQELLGKGAEVLRRLIVKNLYSRLDLEYTEHDNWTLVDYVHHARTAETALTISRAT